MRRLVKCTGILAAFVLLVGAGTKQKYILVKQPRPVTMLADGENFSF